MESKPSGRPSARPVGRLIVKKVKPEEAIRRDKQADWKKCQSRERKLKALKNPEAITKSAQQIYCQ
jgi:hypothetical protein